MKTDYRDFEYFDFHDSYFENADRKADRFIWYLSAVNVSPECKLNPKSCSMMASEMRIEFVDCKIQPQELDVKRLAEENFEILEVKRISKEDSAYTYLFCMTSRRDYIEVELTFTNVLFEWEKYEAKAWYVYTKEKDDI